LVFDFIFSVQVKRLAGRSVSKMTYFVLSGTLNLNQSLRVEMVWRWCM